MQRCIDAAGRSISARSRWRCLRNTVSSTIRRPGPIQYEIRTESGLRTEMEPQLPKPTPKLAVVRLAQRHTSLGEQIDPELDLAELVVAQGLQPFSHLRFRLDLTPWHLPR